eukprot:5143706-Prymnesium_polylepis.1
MGQRGLVVRLHVHLRDGALVRAEECGEYGELRPALQQLQVARVLNEELAQLDGVGERVPADTARQHRDDHARQAVLLVPRVQLVAQPEERRHSRRRQPGRARKPHWRVVARRAPSRCHGGRIDRLPLLRIAVVLDGPCVARVRA